MNEAERDGLSAMRDCWIGGGMAAAMAPAAWLEALHAPPPEERERLLLAIAGQAFEIGFRPAAPKALRQRPALPKLPLPAIPEQHRVLFRSALRHAGDARARLRVIALAEARGYVAHPLDWMPAATEIDMPRVYAPWLDWLQASADHGEMPEALNLENWDEFYPAARRFALADVRRREPAAARVLLEAKVGAESADLRLSLLELLRVNLSADDAPYLKSLTADRSGKVKQLATRLLARIGQRQGDGDDDDAGELADFIEQGRAGLIRRHSTFTPKALKNPTQATRRGQLFDAVQLADLVQALGTTESQFVDGWQMGDKEGADLQLAQMISETGSDEAARKFARKAIDAANPHALAALLPRLDAQAWRSVIDIVLSRGIEHLRRMNAIPDVGASSYDAPSLLGSTLYREMRILVAGRKPEDRTTPDFSLFGYLAMPAAAQVLVTDLAAAGLGGADPSLALLRLNAALAER